MKKLFLVIATFLILASQSYANYYYQRGHVNHNINITFVRYAPTPQMCVFNRPVQVWNRVCGISVSNVIGCSYGYYGYYCGGHSVPQTVCAWQLSYRYQNFVDYCYKY